MELLPTLLGALPELGVIGVALVLLTVFRYQQGRDTQGLRDQMTADRTYFAEERARIRAEAAEDIQRTREAAAQVRAELLEEMRGLKHELREADRETDDLRRQLYPQTPAMATDWPPASRHRLDASGP